MTHASLLALLGYAASVLVALSLMMSSILKLRVINLVGALAFCLYGALIGAWPVAVVNGFIVGINLFHLSRVFTEKEYFKLLRVRADSEYLGCFLASHAEEIRRVAPRFEHDFQLDERSLAFFILRDLVPAGLFLGTLRDDGTLDVTLDYVIPGYRDLRTGRFLFGQQAAFFREAGVRRIVSPPPGDRRHARYLEKMGFRPEAWDHGPLYVRAVG